MKLKIYLGIFIIAIAYLGNLFFKHYTGDVIAHPFIWQVSFWVLGAIGIGVILFAVSAAKDKENNDYRQQVEKFSASARKVIIDIDQCDFKSGSYQQVVDNPELSALKIMSPYEHALNKANIELPLFFGQHIDTTKTEVRHQSYLIYNETAGETNRRYVSQSFPVDQSTLEYYVMTKQVFLYIDRFDNKKFLFRLEK
jgi:hypothetical protein